MSATSKVWWENRPGQQDMQRTQVRLTMKMTTSKRGVPSTVWGREVIGLWLAGWSWASFSASWTSSSHSSCTFRSRSAVRSQAFKPRSTATFVPRIRCQARQVFSSGFLFAHVCNQIFLRTVARHLLWIYSILTSCVLVPENVKGSIWKSACETPRDCLLI